MATTLAGPPVKPQTKVKVPTRKLTIGIVELYKTKDPSLAADLAGYILESYSDKEEMIRDILAAYVDRKSIITAMRSNMKKIYPEESKTLAEIFGLFLFGEKL